MDQNELAQRMHQGQSFLLANDSQFLGKLTFSKYDSESIFSRYGPYGNRYSSTNTAGAGMLYKPKFDTLPTMFIAGDNDAAKREVSKIMEDFGWEVLVSGGLPASRELEAMALVWIRSSIVNGRHHAFKML